MSNRSLGHHLERWAPLVTGLLLALPTLLAYYPPMTDVGLHEAVVGILNHFRDPAYVPPIYTLNLGHPNQAFHGVAWLFSLVIGVRWGCKLTIAIIQVAILVFGARVCDHFGRSRWSAVLLAPLALGFTYYWGLVANLFGFAALLGALPAIERNVMRGTWRAAASSIGLLVLAFFAHESAFVTLAGIAFGIALLLPFDRRLTAIRMAPTFFAFGILWAHYFWQKTLYAPDVLVHPTFYFPFALKVSMLSNVLFGSHDPAARVLMTMLAGLALLTLGVARFRERSSDPAPVDAASASPGAAEAEPTARPRSRFERVRAALFHLRHELISLGFFGLYFVMPFSWKGLTLLHERFFAPGWALLVLTMSPKLGAPRVGALCAAALPAAVLLTAWPQFVDSDRTGRDLAALIEMIPPGSATTLLTVDRTNTPTRVYSGSTSATRVPAERGGRAGMSLTVSPISPVLVKPEYRWAEYDARVYGMKSLALRPSHDLRMFSYVVTYSRDPDVHEVLNDAFRPQGERVGRRGDWSLIASKLAVNPPASAEIPVTAEDAQERAVVEKVVELVVEGYKATLERNARRRAEKNGPREDVRDGGSEIAPDASRPAP